MNGSDGRGVGVGRGVVGTQSSFDSIVQQMSQQVLLMGKIWLKQEERSSRHHSERYNVMLDEFKASTAAWEATMSTAVEVATAEVATTKTVEVATAEVATTKMVEAATEQVLEATKDVVAAEMATVKTVKDVEEENATEAALEEVVKDVDEEEAAKVAKSKTVETATINALKNVEEEETMVEAAVEETAKDVEASEGAMEEAAVEETVKDVEEEKALEEAVKEVEATEDVVKGVEEDEAVNDVEEDEAVEDDAVKDVEEDEAVKDGEDVKVIAVTDAEVRVVTVMESEDVVVEDASLRGKSVDMVDVAADVVGMQEAARMSTQTVVQCGECGDAEEEGGSTRTRWKSWRRARWKRSFLEVTWGTTSCSGGATWVRSGRVLASSEGLVQFERTRLLPRIIATSAHVRTACA